MAKHEVVIHENTGATKELAPYLGSYIAKETVKEASFIHEVAQLCGLSAVQLQAILDGSFEAIEELEKSELVRIHTDIGVVCGIITGSFPTADAPFDKERNTLELALRLDESIKLTLTDVVPSIVADESLTKLRVDNVMDLETPRPMNLIHGQHVFRVAGFNMELSDEGAAAYLTNALGVTFPLVIDEVISKQLFKAHTATLLEAGDYKLVVKSRAGDAEGPLQTAFRRVKYLHVVDLPTVTRVWGDDEDGKVGGGCAMHIAGRDLYVRETTGNEERVTFKWKSDGAAKSEWRGFGELTVNDDHTQVDVTQIPIVEEPVDGNVFDIVVATRGSDPEGELHEIEYKNIPWVYV